MKKQNGITLISLIITIIIMLILAGVSLSRVIGDGLIIDQANVATEKTRISEITEQINLAKSSNQMVDYSNVGSKKTKSNLVEELYKNNKITENEKNKLLGENGETEVDSIVISDVTVDFSVLDNKNEEIEVTTDNLTTLDFAQDNVTYKFSGNFSNDVTIKIQEGLNQTFDGTGATFSGNLVFNQGIAHDYSSLNTTRSGNLNIKNINARTINVNAINMQNVKIDNNIISALSVVGGNFNLIINGNNIDGNTISYVTGNSEHGTNEYGISLRIIDYELSITNNVITNIYSHAIGINGRQDEQSTVGWIDGGKNNVIKSFLGNDITVNSTKKSSRAALKIWNDKVYAPYATSGQEPTENAKILISKILSDTNNRFSLGEGHVIFNIYDYKTNIEI